MSCHILIPVRKPAKRAATALLVAGICLACPGLAAQPGARTAQPGARTAQPVARTAQPGADNGCGPVVDSGGATVLGQGTRSTVRSSSTRKCTGVATQPAAAARPAAGRARHRPAAGAPSQRELPHFTSGPAQPGAAGARDGAATGPAVLDTQAGRVGAAVLTGGAVIWLLQSSLWTSLLILGLPLWRHVDLLPIVDRAADAPVTRSPKREATEEQAVADMLDAKRGQRSGSAPAP
jgi:hypothetical protein